jgi:hypothetical protein
MTTTKTTEIHQLNTGHYIEEKVTELGSYFVYSDYTTDDKIDPAIMQCFVGNPQHKIPRRLWNQMVTFFMHYLAQGTEVECRYYKRDGDFICVVGSQTVTGASVTYNYALPLYGLDGLQYTRESLVANGWVLYAHFHLHPFDMPSPSGVDDTNEMKTPLLYGIVSIPTGRQTDMDYRIRTTVVANNGYANYRYFPQAWDFIDLPVDSELQTYTHTAYAPVCETQVKRFVYQAPVWQKGNTTTKWLQPAKSGVVYTKSLAEKLKTALENIMLANPSVTVADIEKELPAVLSDLLTADVQYADLFTYDRYNSVDVADPFYYGSGY